MYSCCGRTICSRQESGPCKSIAVVTYWWWANSAQPKRYHLHDQVLVWATSICIWDSWQASCEPALSVLLCNQLGAVGSLWLGQHHSSLWIASLAADWQAPASLLPWDLHALGLCWPGQLFCLLLPPTTATPVELQPRQKVMLSRSAFWNSLDEHDLTRSTEESRIKIVKGRVHLNPESRGSKMHFLS